MLDSGLDQQTIDHYLDGVVLSFIEPEIILQIHQFAVDSGSGETVLNQFVHLLLEFTLATAHDWSKHHDAIFRSESHHALDDLLRGLTCDGSAAFGAMRSAD